MIQFNLNKITQPILLFNASGFDGYIDVGYNIGEAWCYVTVVLPVVLYAAGSVMSNDQDLQLSIINEINNILEPSSKNKMHLQRK